MFNLFAKKDENGEGTENFLSSFKNGIKAKIENIQAEQGSPEAVEAVKAKTSQPAQFVSQNEVKELPDLDAVAGYLLQLAGKLGKVDLLTVDDSVNKESILDVRNFRSIIYFADWEFTRRNGRRLTEITWHSSDFDYNVNTASRFDIVLDSNIFKFHYKTLGDKKKNEVLYKLSLHPSHLGRDFGNMLDSETKTHLEYIVAACIKGENRPRTFPAAYEPKGGDERTYYDLNLVDIANIERKEHRVYPTPFLDLREKGFNPAKYEQLRNEIQFEFYRSFDEHDARFARGLFKIVGDTFFRDHPEKLHIRVSFPLPLWETNDSIALKTSDKVGLGSSYDIKLQGRSLYIFADLTLEEYSSLTESQREFFKPAPDTPSTITPNETMTVEFRGDCSVGINFHATIDSNENVKTTFGEVKFKLV